MDRIIPYKSKISFSVTETCNIRCRHCLASCDVVSKETACWPAIRNAIVQAKRHTHIDTIGVTGGEPFLVFRQLARIIYLCAELGLKASVVTNAFWAGTIKKAKKVLNELKGLTVLGLSTDQFHQEYVPVQNVRNAICAAADAGVHCSVQVCYLGNGANEIERVRRQLSGLEEHFTLYGQPVHPFGRGTEIDGDQIFTYDTTSVCCIAADLPTVNISGDVIGCPGSAGYWKGEHPLKFGNIRAELLESILARADRSLILHTLRVWGPAELFEIAKRQAKREGVKIGHFNTIDTDICTLCEWLLCNPLRASVCDRAVSVPRVRQAIVDARLRDLGESSSCLSPLEDQAVPQCMYN